jgi:hypothetical protein
MKKQFFLMIICASVAAAAGAQPPAHSAPTASVNTQPRVDVLGMPRPIDMHDSVWIEDLTMTGSARPAQGRQDDRVDPDRRHRRERPYLTTGKHNNVLRVTGESIARSLATRWSRRSSRWNRATRSASARRATVVLSAETYRAV